MTKKQLGVNVTNQSFLINSKVMLKEIRIPVIFKVPLHLTDLTRLIKFFILILLHTISKIGMYGLLYILTCSL